MHNPDIYSSVWGSVEWDGMDDPEKCEQGREGYSGTGGRICKFTFLKYSECRICSFFLVL